MTALTSNSLDRVLNVLGARAETLGEAMPSATVSDHS